MHCLTIWANNGLHRSRDEPLRQLLLCCGERLSGNCQVDIGRVRGSLGLCPHSRVSEDRRLALPEDIPRDIDRNEALLAVFRIELSRLCTQQTARQARVTAIA